MIICLCARWRNCVTNYIVLCQSMHSSSVTSIAIQPHLALTFSPYVPQMHNWIDFEGSLIVLAFCKQPYLVRIAELNTFLFYGSSVNNYFLMIYFLWQDITRI